jgi:hypothetical protein
MLYCFVQREDLSSREQESCAGCNPRLQIRSTVTQHCGEQATTMGSGCVFREPNMKTTKQSNRRSSPREDTKKPDDSISLSPERIRDGTSAKTELLNEMLERENRSYYLRHWGINE